MGFYQRRILPHVLNYCCGLEPIHRQRLKVVPRARGRVLEIGMGSGLNLPLYDPARVELVWGLEPAEEMRRLAEERMRDAPFEIRLLDLPGEEIPLEDASIDTVLLTYTLCTIPDTARALAGMRRVLKPGGELLFCEHGEAPDAGIRRWQGRLEPIWKRIGGGCHLTRPIPALIRAAGFHVRELETMYLPGTPKITGFQYWGTADLA